MIKMKKNIINIMLAAGVVFGMASCQKTTIAPLEGMFKAPVKVEATNITSSVEKVEKLRVFNFELTAGSDKANLALVGSSYFLGVNTYMGADEAAAKNGSFIFGKTTVNGKAVKDGSVIVTKSGDAKEYTPEDVYTFDTMLFLEDGSAYNFVWSGKLFFEAEEVAYAELNKVGWSINYGMFGMTMLGIDLISDGVVGTPGAWGNTYSGEGNYLKLELYSADGSVAPGTYVPAKGDNPGPGEFKPGSAAGGTQWTVFAGGSSTTEFVTDGEITVSVDGSGVYTIVLECGVANAKFVGKLQ